MATPTQSTAAALSPCSPPVARGHRRGSLQRPRGGGRKHRGLTCTNCRARKVGGQVRCEGGQPSCKTCEVYHTECRYEKAPSVAQAIAMATRLQEAERALSVLQAQGASSTGEVNSHLSPASAQPSPAPRALSEESGLASRGATVEPATIASPAVVASTAPPVFPTRGHTADAAAAVCLGTPNGTVSSELSLDEDGEIRYYGPTSAVHDPPDLLHGKTQASPAAPAAPDGSSRAETRSAMVDLARESAIWEEFALENASKQTGVPRRIVAELLHLHWTWVAPMFMWVCRPAFIRDMATGGRYYSEFLLTVICAHAAKYQTEDCAGRLLSRARHFLGTAITQSNSIPTVQAMLQLSACELASGLISQAWVYSGIAFRMASDLGLQHVDPCIKSIGPIDRQIRLRLYWSCYFWDKATSLYAGRPPAIMEELPESTLDLLDEDAEIDLWRPYYDDSADLAGHPLGEYPRVQSHTVSCFRNSCKLAVIINDIIVHLYSRRSRAITETALKDIKRRLDIWRTQSPEHLRYGSDNIPSVSPPPHIVAQNLLYYATIILAHRPYWFIPEYYQVCLDAAHNIEKLVLLLEATFGLKRITYLIGYTIYTGASAVLEDAKSSNQGSAHPVLRTFLRALNAGRQRCPLLERSLKIIIKGLNHTTADHQAPVASGDPGGSSMSTNKNGQAAEIASGNGGDATTEAESVHTTLYVPAFPYLDPVGQVDFSMDPYFGALNPHFAAVLDSFPEVQWDADNFLDSLQ